jgi:hypothetical protein
VADLILDSLERFPENQRKARLKRIHAALNNRSARVAAKNYVETLEKAAKRTMEIVLEQMSTLPPAKAKAMRQEICQLAAKRRKR